MPIELPAEPAPGVMQRPSPTRFRDAEPGSKEAEARDKVRTFIYRSIKRWKTASEASSTFRREMRRDQRFAAGMGNQWETEDRQARADEGRPCIEINRIPQFVRQVSNQNRMNRSSIQVNARGKGATKDIANALQALVRSVEVESDADVAYDTATEHQLVSGMGFVRLFAKWADDEAFEQVCRIGRIRNPLAVYWDPSAQEADFSDARWMHVIGVIGKDEYETRWGKVADYQSLAEMTDGHMVVQDWMPEGRVIIAEYYEVTVEKRELLRLSTGQNVWATELEDFNQLYALKHPGEPPPTVVRSREVDKRVVRWAFHNATDILEGNADRTGGREIPGSRIPLFPLIGDERDMDGEVDYRGMVRDARHPQQMYNFWSSSIAEAVALAPKAPWVAAKGQIENYLEDWAEANRVPKAVLMYDPKAVGDHLVPPPQRNTIEPAIQAMVAGLAEANQDLMSVMGLFEPSLGQRGSHSESGKARELLQQQGTVANSNFLDNLQRMKRSLGRALIEWIPVIYDVPRIVHLLQPDGTKKPAVVYAGAENKPADGEFGDITDIFDVGVGQFDVSISTGPSYQNEKQATEAWLLELFKVLPGLAAIGADIVLENSDHEAAKQLARRAKLALPPQFQDESDPEAQIPILQAKMQQQGQLLELANKAIASMAKALEGKELDNDTKKEVAMIQAGAQMAIAQSKLADTRAQVAFQAEAERFRQLVDQIHTETVMDMEQDHMTVQQAQADAGKVLQIREQRDSQAVLQQQQADLAPKPAPGEQGAS